MKQNNKCPKSIIQSKTKSEKYIYKFTAKDKIIRAVARKEPKCIDAEMRGKVTQQPPKLSNMAALSLDNITPPKTQ